MATFEVWYGAVKPLRTVGVNQCNALRFAAEYPGWHSFNARDRRTRTAIAGLVRRGSVRVNEFDQFAIGWWSN